MEKNQLTLSTYYDTVKNVSGLENINMNDMICFKNNELTAEVAERYVNIMVELVDKIANLATSSEEKNKFKALFTMLFSKMCESDCKGILLSDSIQKNKKYKAIIDELYAEFQKERDERNALAKKYNEKQSSEKISLPGIALSLTLKESKQLKPSECVDLMNELDISDREIDKKFKRVPVPTDYKEKVNRVYAKASKEGNHYIQKTGSKKD